MFNIALIPVRSADNQLGKLQWPFADWASFVVVMFVFAQAGLV